ncbi:MAG: hypothetical protein U0694_00615 [Anaerolineae bacterium]
MMPLSRRKGQYIGLMVAAADLGAAGPAFFRGEDGVRLALEGAAMAVPLAGG